MKKLVCLIALASASLCCLAQQNLRSAYFLDGYTYRYRFNPAFYSQQGFAMLGIGNTSIGLESNMSLNAFLQPDKNGNLSSFMSDNVSTETFFKHISGFNNVDLNGSATLLATSFWTGKVFNSIEVNTRMNASATFDGYQVFQLMKDPDPSKTYDISELSGNFTAYSEVAYGLAGDINENIHIGGRVKFLIGLANVNAQIKDVTMTPVGGGKYHVTGDNTAMFFLPNGTNILTKGEVAERDGSYIDPSLAKRIKFSEIELPESAKEALTKIPGFGVAFDFGMSFDFAEYFTAGFSILDLGFMQWRYGKMASFADVTGWDFNGMTHFAADAPEDYKAQYDVISDDLEDAFPFEWYEDCTDSKQLQMLQFTGNVSLEYRMPFYDKLSLGAIFSAHAKIHPMPQFGKNALGMASMHDFNWYEGRLVASVAPLDWLSCSLDYACSNFGHSFGTALNIHCPYFNLFFGADNLIPIFFMQKRGIPSTKLNTSASFGINILFGQRH